MIRNGSPRVTPPRNGSPRVTPPRNGSPRVTPPRNGSPRNGRRPCRADADWSISGSVDIQQSGRSAAVQNIRFNIMLNLIFPVVRPRPRPVRVTCASRMRVRRMARSVRAPFGKPSRSHPLTRGRAQLRPPACFWPPKHQKRPSARRSASFRPSTRIRSRKAVTGRSVRSA